jgi:Cu2+-exporting ATPase
MHTAGLPAEPFPTTSAATSAATCPLPPDAGAGLQVLDDPAEWEVFSSPVPGQPGLWESCVAVRGMHCAACAITVEQALRAVGGVEQAEVNAASARARVVWSAQRVKPSGWMGAVARTGYALLPAADAASQDARRREQRRALWRWLVAGFCMMQVMMYALPAYVAGPGEMTPDVAQLLRWASWVLTLPVVFFSCGPFFASALRDVAQRRIGMDLPVALGMAITFAVSTAGTFAPSGPLGHEVYFDSLTMFVFFLLTGRWFELRLRDRTAGALEALMHRLPPSVERLAGRGADADRFERVAVRRLAVGDIIRVLPGETFPADGAVVRGETRVDEALLTGESRPVARPVGAQVIAGSHNLVAAVQVRVERVGGATRYAQIVALMEDASLQKPRIAQLADRVARPFLLAVLAAAALAGVLWWPVDPGRALMVMVAVLVVTCPCALSLATPAAMLAAAGALARRGVLVRRLQGLEALARVDTLVFDKTGTLTRDGMALGAIQVRDGISEPQALAWAAALASHSLHPVSRALVAAAAARGLPQAPGPALGVQEIPGAGLSGRIGTPPRALRLGSACLCEVHESEAGDARQVHLSDEQGWLATFSLDEDLRPDAAAAVQALQQAGIEVRLLSGDRFAAVNRMAARLGIRWARGECTPRDKLRQLEALQLRGRQVAMVGDGLNDGPVLARAHASFAFGPAVPLAQARADFVVLGDALALVPQTLLLARRTLRVVRQNLAWAAAYNAVCVPLALSGWLPAWLAGLGMALSSLLVVLNAARLSARLPEPVVR